MESDNPLFDGLTQMAEVIDVEREKPSEEKPKRGRPKVTAKPLTPKATKKDVDLSIAVNTIGALIAGIFSHPELAIDEDESKAISQAANRVASYYELPDMGVVGAWVNLGITLGAIVYPRYAMIKAINTEKNTTEEKGVTDNASTNTAV